MVNMVRPACFSPPADGSLLKSQSSETDSLESTTFGEIFKAKEKERKQLEDSAFSAAAVMSAVVRTPPAEKPAESSNSDTGDRVVGSVSGKSENQSQPGSGNISQERLKSQGNQKSYSTEKTDTVESKSVGKQAEGTDKTQRSASQAFAAALDAQEKASVDQSAAKIGAASLKVVEAQMADQVEVVSAQVAPAASQSQVAMVAETNPSEAQVVQTGVVSQVSGEAQGSDGADVVEAITTAQLTETDPAQGTLPTASSGSGPETAGKQDIAQADGKQVLADRQAVSNSETREAGVLSGGVKAATLVQPNAQAASKTQAAPAEPTPISPASMGDELPVAGTSKDANPVLTVQPAPTTTASQVIETVDMKAAGKWAAPQINTQAGEVIQQIVRQMHVTLQAGPGTMRLQLNPKELGAIDVQMVQSAQGVNVTFFAEHGSTGRLLETQMDQLRQSLANSGIQLSNLSISQQGFSGQQGGGYKQAFQFAQQPNSSAGQSEKKAEVETRQRPERIVGQLQGVDYRI